MTYAQYLEMLTKCNRMFDAAYWAGDMHLALRYAAIAERILLAMCNPVIFKR